MSRGPFIVLEGVDGSGTTTQLGRIAEALRARGRRVHTTAEPSAGPIGVLLRRALSGRLEPNDAQAPHWTTLSLLFSADRLDHIAREIEPQLAAGVLVLCDRYDGSTLAYQSCAGGGEAVLPWLRELNRHAPRPDLTLVLDVPAHVAAARRRARSGVQEIFDADELQQKLGRFYAELERHAPHDRIVHVDGSATPAEVTADALFAIDALEA